MLQALPVGGLHSPELLPVRGNGDLISTDAVLPFLTVIYHTGQYPPASGAGAAVVHSEADGDAGSHRITVGEHTRTAGGGEGAGDGDAPSPS